MKSTVSVLEFRRLLHEIKDRRPELCIRFRLMGQLWEPFFMNVLILTEQGGVFGESSRGSTKSLDDLSKVIQFELDKSFHGYQAHFHYEVRFDEPLLQSLSASGNVNTETII
jgi:hypothetical protein